MAIRSTATATIQMGLVAIPVKFYLATAAEAVAFNQFSAAGHRVRQKLVDEITGEEVARDTLTKGYEVAKGQWVIFAADELKALELEGQQRAVEIEKCVPEDAIDLIQAEKSYYLGPDKGGERAYRLLVQTLAATRRIAIAQWGTRGREHLVAIRARGGGLVLHALYYANEVRPQEEVTGAVPEVAFADRELAMARSIIEGMTEPTFEIGAYRDRYRERVLAAVEAKVAGQEIVIPVAPAAPIVLDLFAALSATLEKQGAAPVAPTPVEAAPEAAPEATHPKKRKGKKAA